MSRTTSWRAFWPLSQSAPVSSASTSCIKAGWDCTSQCRNSALLPSSKQGVLGNLGCPSVTLLSLFHSVWHMVLQSQQLDAKHLVCLARGSHSLVLTTQGMIQHACLSISQSVNQSINQSINQPVNPSINQPINQSTYIFCLGGSSGESADNA